MRSAGVLVKLSGSASGCASDGDDLASDALGQVDDHGTAQVSGQRFARLADDCHHVDAIGTSQVQHRELSSRNGDSIVGRELARTDHRQRNLHLRQRLQPSDISVVRIGNDQPMAARFEANQSLRKHQHSVRCSFDFGPNRRLN